MSRTFEHFHLSLKSRYPLFEQELASRESWLREIFSEQFEFTHRNEAFTWVPAAPAAVIVGKVLRRSIEEKFLGPDQGGRETRGPEWRGAIVVIDPTTHEDGQKAAVERQRRVGTPSAILASLLMTASTRLEDIYTIEAKRIWNQREFITWAGAHQNRVKKIEFDFVVPNMWGVTSELEDELEQVGDLTKAQKVKVVLHGEAGVETDNDVVGQAVEYSARGSGRVKAVAEDNDVFNSEGKATVVTLEEIPEVADLSGEELNVWSSRILGREEGEEGPL